MAGLFSLAAQKARQMAEGKPDPITIDAGPFKVKIPMADGGLSSVQKNISIETHGWVWKNCKWYSCL